jgi:hypothetical protein
MQMSIVGSQDFSSAFRHHDIDGQAFLELDNKDLPRLCYKLGPAIKI